MAADTVTFRALQLHDVAEVERLHKYATHQGKPVFPQYGAEAASVLRAAAAQENRSFGVVALLGDPAEPEEPELVGAATAQMHSSSTHTTAGNGQQQAACELVLLTLAVRADVRQQGVGGRMLQAVMQQAHQQAHPGCLQRVVADIGINNKPAWQFFQRAGFTRGPAIGSTAEAVMLLGQLELGRQDSSSRSSSATAALANNWCTRTHWQPARPASVHGALPGGMRALLHGCSPLYPPGRRRSHQLRMHERRCGGTGLCSR